LPTDFSPASAGRAQPPDQHLPRRPAGVLSKTSSRRSPGRKSAMLFPGLVTRTAPDRWHCSQTPSRCAVANLRGFRIEPGTRRFRCAVGSPSSLSTTLCGVLVRLQCALREFRSHGESGNTSGHPPYLLDLRERCAVQAAGAGDAATPLNLCGGVMCVGGVCGGQAAES